VLWNVLEGNLRPGHGGVGDGSSELCLQIAPSNLKASHGSNDAFCFDERTCAEVLNMTAGKGILCLLPWLPFPDSSASPVGECVVVSPRGPGLIYGQRTMKHIRVRSVPAGAGKWCRSVRRPSAISHVLAARNESRDSTVKRRPTSLQYEGRTDC
jgi:hypothetical protein